MSLWVPWMNAVRSLRPACQRSRTFLWMVLTLIGLCCRLDLAGVTSYVRVLGLRPEAYHRFLSACQFLILKIHHPQDRNTSRIWGFSPFLARSPAVSPPPPSRKYTPCLS